MAHNSTNNQQYQQQPTNVQQRGKLAAPYFTSYTFNNKHMKLIMEDFGIEHYTLDAFASKWNAKAPLFCSVNEEEGSYRKNFFTLHVQSLEGHVVWANPLWRDIGRLCKWLLNTTCTINFSMVILTPEDRNATWYTSLSWLAVYSKLIPAEFGLFIKQDGTSMPPPRYSLRAWMVTGQSIMEALNTQPKLYQYITDNVHNWKSVAGGQRSQSLTKSVEYNSTLVTKQQTPPQDGCVRANCTNSSAGYQGERHVPVPVSPCPLSQPVRDQPAVAQPASYDNVHRVIPGDVQQSRRDMAQHATGHGQHQNGRGNTVYSSTLQRGRDASGTSQHKVARPRPHSEYKVNTYNRYGVLENKYFAGNGSRGADSVAQEQTVDTDNNNNYSNSKVKHNKYNKRFKEKIVDTNKHAIGNGFISVYPRPTDEMLVNLKKQGCTHIVSLLALQEGLQNEMVNIEHHGFTAHHVATRANLEDLRANSSWLQEVALEIAGLIQQGHHVAIHCHMGIHRSGTLLWAVLRLLGTPQHLCQQTIRRIRPITAKQMGYKRMTFAEEELVSPLLDEPAKAAKKWPIYSLGHAGLSEFIPYLTDFIVNPEQQPTQEYMDNCEVQPLDACNVCCDTEVSTYSWNKTVLEYLQVEPEYLCHQLNSCGSDVSHNDDNENLEYSLTEDERAGTDMDLLGIALDMCTTTDAHPGALPIQLTDRQISYLEEYSDMCKTKIPEWKEFLEDLQNPEVLFTQQDPMVVKGGIQFGYSVSRRHTPQLQKTEVTQCTNSNDVNPLLPNKVCRGESSTQRLDTGITNARLPHQPIEVTASTKYNPIYAEQFTCAPTERLLQEEVDICTITENPKTQQILNVSKWNPDHAQTIEKLLAEVPEIGNDVKFDPSIIRGLGVEYDVAWLDKPAPFRSATFRLSPIEQQYMAKILNKYKMMNWIRESNSPWAAPTFLVPKKSVDAEGNKEWRLVIDYRRLNNQTVRLSFPLPKIDTIFNHLNGATIFSNLDLQSGYHQIPLSPEASNATGFVCAEGHYQFNVLPFGLHSAPPAFQKMMEKVLAKPIKEGIACVYLDDVLVYSKTAAEHEEHLRIVFQCLAKANLRIRPDKCNFFQTELEYLGHVISGNGVQVDPDKVKAMVNFERPSTLKKLQSFMGMCNYYRRFVHMYSKVANKLFEVYKVKTKGKNPHIYITKNLQHKYPGATVYKLAEHEGKAIEWTEEVDKAFQQLKDELSKADALKYPDRNKGYDIFTDASDVAIGGSLEQEGKPIAFFSKKLNKVEKNYMTYEKEALALVQAVKQWHHLIHNGHPIVAHCDNKGVSCLLRQNFSIARQARWAAFLQQYNLTIVFVPGKENVVADAFTRQYDETDCTGVKDVELAETLHMDLVNFVSNIKTGRKYKVKHQVLATSSTPLLDSKNDVVTQPVLGKEAKAMWKTAYLADDDLAPIYSHLADGTHIAGKNRANKFVLAGGVLRTKAQDRIAVPASMRPALLRTAHSDVHVGPDKLAHRLTMFWWPAMLLSIRNYCQNCLECARNKGSVRRIGGPVQALTPMDKPFQRLHFDLVGPLPAVTVGTTVYDTIFTIIDSYSKFAWAIPTNKHLTGTEMARLFITHVMPFSGIPQELVTDRGSMFVQHFFTELVKAIGIHHKLPSPYPQSNGVLERWHRDLNGHLRAAVLSLKKDKTWLDGVGVATYAHNTTYHTVLGMSPYSLCFGMEASNPIDEWKRLCLPPDQVRSVTAETRLDLIHKHREMVTTALQKAQRKMQRILEQRRRVGKNIQAGDWILVDANRGGDKSKLPKLQPRVLGPFKVTSVVEGQVNFEVDPGSRMVPKANAGDCIPYDEALADGQIIFDEVAMGDDGQPAVPRSAANRNDGEEETVTYSKNGKKRRPGRPRRVNKKNKKQKDTDDHGEVDNSENPVSKDGDYTEIDNNGYPINKEVDSNSKGKALEKEQTRDSDGLLGSFDNPDDFEHETDHSGNRVSSRRCYRKFYVYDENDTPLEILKVKCHVLSKNPVNCASFDVVALIVTDYGDKVETTCRLPWHAFVRQGRIHTVIWNYITVQLMERHPEVPPMLVPDFVAFGEVWDCRPAIEKLFFVVLDLSEEGVQKRIEEEG